MEEKNKMEEKKEVTLGFNTLCENYKTKLVELVNESGLPIGAVYFITKNIMAEIENTYYGVLNSEAVKYEEVNHVG